MLGSLSGWGPEMLHFARSTDGKITGALVALAAVTGVGFAVLPGDDVNEPEVVETTTSTVEEVSSTTSPRVTVREPVPTTAAARPQRSAPTTAPPSTAQSSSTLDVRIVDWPTTLDPVETWREYCQLNPFDLACFPRPPVDPTSTTTTTEPPATTVPETTVTTGSSSTVASTEPAVTSTTTS